MAAPVMHDPRPTRHCDDPVGPLTRGGAPCARRIQGRRMLPKPLLYAVVIAVTAVWVVAAIADILSDAYDAQGVHLIFGGIVGGLIGLARRGGDNGDGGKS